MKIWQVPFTKIVKGYIEVAAENEEEAYEKASSGDVVEEVENKTDNDFDKAIVTDINVCDGCGEIDVNHTCTECGMDLCNSCSYDYGDEEYCDHCKPVDDDGSREREIQQDWR